MPVSVDRSQTTFPWIAVRQFFSISGCIVIPIPLVLPTKSINSLLHLLIIVMASEVQPSLNAECIVTVHGIRLVQVDIGLSITVTGILLPPRYQMVYHWPTFHILCPSNQLLSLHFGCFLFEVSPTVMNDIHIGRYIVCNAEHLVLVSISTSSSLASILHNGKHTRRAKYRSKGPLQLTFVGVVVTIIVARCDRGADGTDDESILVGVEKGSGHGRD
mmetsp:Transcript_25028/g.45084  ORF Transcript_25028/g.45084 Transcript_25028/m.45084 type:complete len:217 (-) Transcript_25028:95-745(-)